MIPLESDDMTQLTVEYMREWENRLTEDQMSKAIGFVQANGWPTGSEPPIFVWAEAFRYAENRTNNLGEKK